MGYERSPILNPVADVRRAIHTEPILNPVADVRRAIHTEPIFATNLASYEVPKALRINRREFVRRQDLFRIQIIFST